MSPHILTCQPEGKDYWRAVFQGHRNGDPCGFGDSEGEAIADLMVELAGRLQS